VLPEPSRLTEISPQPRGARRCAAPRGCCVSDGGRGESTGWSDTPATRGNSGRTGGERLPPPSCEVEGNFLTRGRSRDGITDKDGDSRTADEPRSRTAS